MTLNLTDMRQEPLDPELEARVTATVGGFTFITHPFVHTVHAPVMNAIHNHALRCKKEMFAKYVAAGNWHAVVMVVHERPYRLDAMEQYGPKIADDRAYFNLLRDCWTDTENAWQIGVTRLRRLFAPKGRDLTARTMTWMNPLERKTLAGLEDPVTVTRGCRRSNQRGFSWTLDVNKARWFASRLNAANGGVVVTGRVPRDRVIALLLDRGEQEVVADPRDVKVVGIAPAAKPNRR